MPDFLVNTTTALDQLQPAVTALADGRVVFTWFSNDGGDGSGQAVRARIYDPANPSASADFIVNTTTTLNQFEPAVTTLADGRVAFVWSDQNGDGFGTAIRARIYDPANPSASADFIVNTTTASTQLQPAVTALADGRVVFTWYSNDTGDGSGTMIRARIYDPANPSASADFIVNTTTAFNQVEPAVTALADGRVVFTWTNVTNGDGSGSAIRARIYDPADPLASADFIVNTTTENSQFEPAVAALADGRVVFTWHSFDTGDGSGTAIRASIISPSVAPAFTSDGGGATAAKSVPENTTLVTTLTADDPDVGQTLTYSISGGENAALFEIRNGNELHFVSAPDFEALPAAGATPNYQVEVQVSDGNGGVDSQAITVTVDGVNEAPVLDDSQSPVLEIVQEDAGPPPPFPVGTLVADLVGAGNVTDVDVGAVTGMALTGADESNGTWWYSIDGGFSWDVVGPVSDTLARVLAADFDTMLYFEPNFGFTDSATVTFRAWDQTDGSLNGEAGVDTTPPGGNSAFSALSDTATVEVNAQPVIDDVDGDAVTFTEGDSFVMVDAVPTAASVADIDSPDLEGGDLMVEFCGCFTTDDDELFIRAGNGITLDGTNVLYNGDVIGVVQGGVGLDPLLIFFTTEDATPAAASALVRQIAYRNTNIEEPLAAVHTVSFSIFDGDGGLSNFADVTVEVITVNDAPTLAAVAGASYTDTTGNDMFAPVSGTLVGDDPDNVDLIYGIVGGTTGGSTNIGGTVYDVSRISNFGTLYVASDTGEYTFVPRDAAIEALKAGATQSFTVRVSDGTLNDTQTLDITFNGANDAPLAAMGNQNLQPNEWVQLQGRLSARDSDDSITQYQLYDAGAAAGSGYFWTADLGRRAADTYITIDADDLATTWLRGGAATGGELMWVRAFNGTTWSEWDPFTLTTSNAAPGPNTPPVVTADDQNLQIGDAITLDSMVGVSDADGDTVTQYQFYDAGTAADSGYLWTVNGGQRAAGQYFTIAAADLETVELRAGQAAGTDVMWVRAFDGIAWGEWDAFTLVTQEGANAAPVVTIDNQAVPTSGSAAVDSFISAVDADGDPIVQYQFYDAGSAADSGYFSTAGVQRDPHTYINVAAADLAGVGLHGGAVPGTELMWVRGYDGTAWSAWDPFFLITNGT